MLAPILATRPPYIPDPGQLAPFSAELVLIGSIVSVLIGAFFTKERTNRASGLIALAGIVLAGVALVATASDVAGLYFRDLLVMDGVAFAFKALLLMFTGGIVLMWFSTVADRMHPGDGPEFFTLLLGATLGMSLMVSSANLLMLFLAVELASLPSYVLAGFRKTHRLGAEAALKYVLFGAATSAIMAYGLSLLYGVFGTLRLDVIADQIAMRPGGDPLVAVALLGLIVGLGFKISAVPFHLWCPDVFEGAGIDVSAFLSVASKGAAIVLLMRVLMSIAEAFGYAAAPTTTALAVVIAILAAVTITVGNTAAFWQDNIKRLLAYSSIAHAGYILCALSLLVANAPGFSPGDVTAAVLLYLAVYLFMNLGAFTVAALIERATGSEDIRDYAGLSRRAPVLAVCMAAFMFSLVGLPPLAGFVAKLNLMFVLANNGAWWWALVAVIGLNTVVSLYYYARVVRVIFLVPSDAPAFSAAPLGTAVSVVCALMLFLMLMAFQPVITLAERYGGFYHAGAREVVAAPAPGEPVAAARP